MISIVTTVFKDNLNINLKYFVKLFLIAHPVMFFFVVTHLFCLNFEEKRKIRHNIAKGSFGFKVLLMPQQKKFMAYYFYEILRIDNTKIVKNF